MEKLYEYDVAISYASPDRVIAEKLANILRTNGLTVFFDLFEQERVWGKKLYVFLSEVYENKARYCIVLISKHYRDRVWTRHEIQSAFNRAVRERGEYILPIRLDNTPIDGLPSDLAYISTDTYAIEEIANIFVRMIGNDTHPPLVERLRESIAGVFQNRFSALEALIAELENENSEIWIVAGTMYGLLTASERPISNNLLKLLQEKSKQGVKIRIMMLDPESVESIGLQEMRAPGALREEQKYSIEFLRSNLPDVEVKLLKVAPVYFAVLLSEKLLYNPYSYTIEASNSPVIVLNKTGQTSGIFEIFSRDIPTLWEMAYFIEGEK